MLQAGGSVNDDIKPRSASHKIEWERMAALKSLPGPDPSYLMTPPPCQPPLTLTAAVKRQETDASVLIEERYVRRF